VRTTKNNHKQTHKQHNIITNTSTTINPMSKKHYNNKGRKTPVQKTKHQEISIKERITIVTTSKKSTPAEIQKNYPQYSESSIQKLINRAKTQSTKTRSGNTHGVPLADITNVINQPGRHTQEPKLTTAVRRHVISAITKDQASRRKHLKTHRKELQEKGICNISVDSIRQILYNAYYSFTQCNYKPKLTQEL
jgi:hypothetical protein